MDRRTKIKVVTRQKAVRGKFQAELVPYRTLSEGEFVEWWSSRSAIRAETLRLALATIGEGIQEALASGYRVELGLATFYPHLSGALSSRDADPEMDGRYVRGAVMARRALVDCLRQKLDPVNTLASLRVRLFSVVDTEATRPGTIAAGHKLHIIGENIPVVAGRPDEGVWLEKRMRRGLVRVATARILSSSITLLEAVFDNLPPHGKYNLIVGTRCGRSTDYKIVRCRYAVTVD